MMATSDGSLRLSRGAGYALRAMARLALAPAPGVVPVSQLARQEGLPRNFLAKIVRNLARGRLVAARPGMGGGVRLLAPAERISLLEILEACEGSYARRGCAFFPEHACGGDTCQLACVLREEEKRIRSSLAKLTLAQVARTLAGPSARFSARAGRAGAA